MSINGLGHACLYAWLHGVSRESRKAEKQADLATENARLRAELRRVEEERDILKKAAAYFAKASG